MDEAKVKDLIDRGYTKQDLERVVGNFLPELKGTTTSEGEPFKGFTTGVSGNKEVYAHLMSVLPDETPAPEQQPQEEVHSGIELPGPSQMVAPDRTEFGNMFSDTQEFSNLLVDVDVNFINEITSAETATAKMFIQNGIVEGMDEMLLQEQANIEQSGNIGVQDIREDNIEASKQAFMQVQGQGDEVLAAVKEDIEAEQAKPDMLVLMEDLVREFTDRGMNQDGLKFLTVGSGIFKQRQVQDIISAGIADQFESRSALDLLDDFGEAVADGLGLSNRQHRREIISNVQGTDATVSDYRFFRSGDIEELVDNKYDTMSFEEQKAFVLKVLEASKASESILGNNNVLYSSELLEELQDALAGEYGGNDWVSWLELAGLGGTAAIFARNVKPFLKATTLKVLRTRDAYYGLDVSTDMEEVIRLTEEMIKAYDPNASAVNTLKPFRETNKNRVILDQAFRGDKNYKDPVYSVLRLGNAQVGNVAESLAPEVLRSLFNESRHQQALPSTLKALGLKPDDVALSTAPKIPNELSDGINPRTLTQNEGVPVSSDLAGRKSAVQLYQERPIGLLLSRAEVVSAAMPKVSRIEKLSGDTLSVHLDKTDIASDESGYQLTARFGESDSKGFSSFDEAVAAASNLVGEEFTVAVKHPNRSQFSTVTEAQEVPMEYFVQLKSERTFLPSDGVAFLDGSTWYSENPVSKLLLTYSDRISRNIINDFSVLKDYNLAVTKKLQATLKPYSKTSGTQREQINRLLALGDKQQVNYTLAEVNRELGTNLTSNSKVWKGYQSVRQYYDDLADINDIRVRAELDKKHYKDLSVRDERGNKVYGRALTPEEFKADKGTKVYDADTRTVVDAESLSLLDNRRVFRLKQNISVEGEYFNLIVRSTDEVKPLPSRVIPRRGGYVNRAYKNVGGIVKIVSPRNVNGVLQADGASEVVRLARSLDDANDWKGTRVSGSSKTNEELLLEGAPEGSRVVVEDSREAIFELSDVEVRGDNNVTPFNLRGRSEAPIESVRGMNEVLGVEASISKSMGSVNTALTKDSIGLMKARFMSQYGKYLKDPKSFPESKTLTFVSEEKTLSVDKLTHKNMRNIHAYIQDMERLSGFRSDTVLEETVAGVVGGITGNRFKGVRGLETIKGAATFMAIYGRPLFQILANSSQAITLSTRDPIRGTASIVEATLAAPAIALRRSGKLPKSDLYAKLIGFENHDNLVKWIDSIETAGVFSAAQLDNLLSRIDTSRKVASKSTTMRIGKAALLAPKTAQAIATDVNNLIAYRHAVKLAVDKFPGVDPYSKRGLINVHNIFRELTLDMNKSDAVLSETSVMASFPLLWTQHVYKGWKQTVAKPAIRTFTGRTFAKNDGPWASSYKQALITTAMNGFFFGGAGLLGNEAVLELDEFARKKGLIDNGESLGSWFYEGSLDMGVKYFAGVDINSAERISFSDAPSMMLSLSGLDEGTLNIIGGSGIAFTRLGQFFDTLQVMKNTPRADKEDMADILGFVGGEFLNVFSGWKDWEKAALARNMGIYFSSGGNPLYEVDPEQELGILFSFRPDDAGLRERIVFDKKGTPDEANLYTKTLPATFGRMFWSKMLKLEEAGELTFTAYMNERNKYWRYIDGATGNLGASNLGMQAKSAFNKITIDPTGLFTSPELNKKNTTMVKNLMDNYSFTEAKAKLEQVATLADDPNLKEKANQMLEILAFQHKILAEEK